MKLRSGFFNAATTALAVAAGVALCTPSAQAHGRGYGGPRVGVYIGGPLYYGPRYYSPPAYYGPPAYYYGPRYYPPPAYYYDYPPVVRVPAPPVVYVERGDGLLPGTDNAPLQSVPSAPPQAAAPQVQQPPVQGPQWFFCADSGTYYPYVRECASPWQSVPAQPPGAR